MSRSNHPRPPRRRARATVDEAPPPPVTISIITHPRGEGSGPSLDVDVSMVKSALLYADKVELISLSASMISGTAALAAGGENSLLALLESLDGSTLESLGAGGLPPNWREVVGAMRLGAKVGLLDGLEAKAQVEQFEETLRAGLAQWQDSTGDLLARSGAQELEPCLEAGILEVSDSGLGAAVASEDVIPRWLDIIDERLKNPRSRLLFDDRVGRLISARLAETDLQPTQNILRNIHSAALGSGLVARLPAFPQASMDELLALRADLNLPLARYRRVVSRLARDLPDGAIGQELEAAIDDVWISEVRPAILELEDLLAHHGLVREIARATSTDVRLLMVEGFGVYVALAGPGGVASLAAASIGAASAGVQAVASGATRSSQARRAVQENDLFYLYEAGRRLAR